MPTQFLPVILILIGYFFGSINSAIIVCKCLRLPSPRSIGSGNPGATNVLRLGSKTGALITLLGDAIKGIIPVLIGHYFQVSDLILALIALAAVIGHLYPIFFGFKGGKGVATTLGVLLAFNLWLGLAVVATWLLIAFAFRYSSLASLVASILAPVYAYFLVNHEAIIPLILIAILVIIRHYPNIMRLIGGTESKIGKKK